MLCRDFSFPAVDPFVWRIVGLVSSLVGFITYAMSPPFNKVFKLGELGFLVVVIYCAVGSLFCCLMLCTTRWNLPEKSVFTAHGVFLVVMVTSMYSFYLDKAEGNTKRKDEEKVLNLVSCGAFSFMSLSLSRLTRLQFEAGLFNFFLGSLMVAVMNWNLKFTFIAAVLCYILINIRTYWDSELEDIPISNVDEAQLALIEAGSWMERLNSVPLELSPHIMYDVFISFKGKDTSDIPEFLTCSLLKKSLRIYAHQELTENYVSPTVLGDIQKALVSVIIFSKSYLETVWCLHELCNVMGFRRFHGRTVIPIFYNIDPVTIKDPSVNFLRIKKLCHDNGVSPLLAFMMRGWSEDLAEVASLQGWEMLTAIRPYKLLEDVADDVLNHCDPNRF